MYKKVKKFSFLICLLGIFHISSLPNVVASDHQLTIEEIAGNKDLLREIAFTIFQRRQDISYIEDKICTHGPQILEYWKENKWQKIGSEKRQELKRILTSKFNIDGDQVRRLLQRDDYMLLNQNVIDNYVSYGLQAIKEGSVELDKSKGNQKYGIKVAKNFPSEEIGAKITRKGDEFEIVPVHSLTVTFQIDDIIEKILKSGVDAWNKERDGKATTFCSTD
jgi:hypothetical protein